MELHTSRSLANCRRRLEADERRRRIRRIFLLPLLPLLLLAVFILKLK
ncbi:MAG: hypothetical protein L6W00_27145 [Lentisphaeria bacterium]|nr:MAG: hypothetical protein L6W00_27145 [Lentisphaeria bacterium]